MDDHDDTPDAVELEQLALSLAIDGSLGRRDAQRVADVLRGGGGSVVANALEWRRRGRPPSRELMCARLDPDVPG